MGGANTQTQQWKPNPQDVRSDGTMKGSGFLGVMKRLDNPNMVSSEISIGVDWGSGEKEIPTMVPTLDSNEIKYLLSTPEDKLFTSNSEIGKSIKQKAIQHAIKREKQGLPYFAEEQESPKQQINIMGGSPTQAMKDYQHYAMKAAMKKAPVEEGAISPAPDQSAYAQFPNLPQNFSETVAGLIEQAPKVTNPNYNRDVSPAAVQDKTK